MTTVRRLTRSDFRSPARPLTCWGSKSTVGTHIVSIMGQLGVAARHLGPGDEGGETASDPSTGPPGSSSAANPPSRPRSVPPDAGCGRSHCRRPGPPAIPVAAPADSLRMRGYNGNFWPCAVGPVAARVAARGSPDADVTASSPARRPRLPKGRRLLRAACNCPMAGRKTDQHRRAARRRTAPPVRRCPRSHASPSAARRGRSAAAARRRRSE